MGHDELCLLSGIRPGGEPRNLLYQDSVDTVMAEMTDEIKVISRTTPPDLDSILREPLVLAAHEDYEENTWRPPGFTWLYFDTCIAIGYFDEFGCCAAAYHDEATGTGAPRAPGGHDVELRRVHTNHGRGWFGYVVTGDGEPKRRKVIAGCTPATRTSSSSKDATGTSRHG